MKYPIHTTEDLGLIIRAVRKNARVRRDDLAASLKLSQQFAFDAERGKPTIQFGRLLRILKELGIALNVEVPDEVAGILSALKVRAQEKAKSAHLASSTHGAGERT